MAQPRTLLELFLLDGVEHHVHVLWLDDDPYFRGLDVANILQMTNLRSTLSGKSFIKDIDYKLMMCNTSNGQQPTTYLTESGLHNLLMISRKPVAQPFRRWVIHALNEIRERGKYDLQVKLEEIQQRSRALQLEIDMAQQTLQERVDAILELHRPSLRLEAMALRNNTLVNVYNKKPCVYIGVIKPTGQGPMSVKIGCTNNLGQRSQRHKTNFGEFLVMDVFHVQAYTSFEQFIHKHPMIVAHKQKEFTYYDATVKKMRKSNEVYLLDEQALQDVRRIINDNKNKFMGDVDREAVFVHEEGSSSTDGQEIEAKAKIEKEIDAEIDAEMEKEAKAEMEKEAKAKMEKEIDDEIDAQIYAEIMNEKEQEAKIEKEKEAKKELKAPTPLPIIYVPNSERPKINRGPKLQIYDPKTRTLVHTFETLLDATRENPHFPGNASKPMIATALKQHVTYKGYIWMQLARHEPDDTVQTDLPEVDVGKKSVNIGLLAMLNLNKDRVLDVFPDMKTATAARKFKTVAAISKAVIHGTISSGHYWAMWESLAPELRADYLAAGHTLPEKARRSNSRAIEQRDGTTNQLIRTFVDTETVIREVGLARKTLKGAIEGRYRVKGFMWAFAPAPAEKA
jgi:prophage antirepressor-like protein